MPVPYPMPPVVGVAVLLVPPLAIGSVPLTLAVNDDVGEQVDPRVQDVPSTVVAELASAEFGTETNLAFGNVPLVIFAAFVVSVVAEAASVTGVPNPPRALLVNA